MHRSNTEHKCMKEHEDVNVATSEKYRFDGANAFTWMTHKHKGHTLE